MFDDLAGLDPGAVLAVAADLHAASHRAEADLLRVAAHWADLHAPELGAPVLCGEERALTCGGEGCPKVGEFACVNLGAALGLSSRAAAGLISDALGLRHRMPRLWAAVQAGVVMPWRARRIVHACISLSRAAADVVDSQVAEIANRVGPWRLRRIIEAAVLAVDPERARANAEAMARSRGVWVGRSDCYGTKTMGIRAAAGDVARLDARIDQVADILAELGDLDDKDQRRAKAIGWLADPHLALELLINTTTTTTGATSAEADMGAESDAGAESDMGGGSDAGGESDMGASPDTSVVPGPGAEPGSNVGSDAQTDFNSDLNCDFNSDPEPGPEPGPDGWSMADTDDGWTGADPGADGWTVADPDGWAEGDPEIWTAADATPRAEADVGAAGGGTGDAAGDAAGDAPGDAPGDAAGTAEAEAGAGEGDEASVESRRMRVAGDEDGPGGLDGRLRLLAGLGGGRAGALPPGVGAGRGRGGRGGRRGRGGGVTGSRYELYVHLTDQTLASGVGVVRTETVGRGKVTGDDLGPLLASQLEELLGPRPGVIVVRPVIDLRDQVSVDAYEIPDRIRERVRLRYPVCIFPWCNRPAVRCDLDHVKPHTRDRDGTGPPGQTGTDNLAPACRFHHRLKTHGGWSVERLPDGAFVWTGPHGDIYLVDHTGTRLIRRARGSSSTGLTDRTGEAAA